MKYFLSLVISFVLLFNFTSLAFAQTVVNSSNQENIILEKNQIVPNDFFAAGNSVTLAGTVEGDAYVAGGNINIEGTVNGDLLAAGGNIVIGGQVLGNVRTAGGNVTISGNVGRNVTAAGGNVTIAESAKIGGSLASGTGNLQVFAPIAKGITAGAGSMTIGNTVGGDITAGVGQLIFTPQAKVAGNINYSSDRDAQIAQGAVLSGSIHRNEPPMQIAQENEKFREGFSAFAAFWRIIQFISLVLLGSIVVALLPIYVQDTINVVMQKPWLSLGIGVLSLLVVPALIFFFLISVIGIPFIFLLLAILILLYILAKTIAAAFIGQKVLEYTSRRGNTIGVGGFIIGAIILTVIGFIPIIGPLATMILGSMALGAVLIQQRNYYTNLRTKKLI